MDISKFGVKDGDIVCFSFGEIDVRANMARVKDPFSFIDQVVENYFNVISQNVNQFNNLKVMVSCIPPVSKQEDTALYYIDNNWATIGSDKERKDYTEYFNAGFRQQCINYHYIYYDFYNDYCAEDGFMNMLLSDGTWHIKDVKHMVTKLIEIINTL